MAPVGCGVAAVAAGLAVALAGCGSSSSKTSAATAPTTTTVTATTQATPAPTSPPPPPPRPHAPFAVGVRVITLVDTSHTVAIPGEGTVPRKLVTIVRYPALGPPANSDANAAPPARAGGPFPLVIFGHGFAVTPGIYSGLLRAWVRAGYIVAAPIFPLENENAPGGPDENDLVNQPRDMSFVITQLLAASAARSGFLSDLIDPRRIAVSGQSDGGDTALAVAYDDMFADRRVGAAVILSGAKIPGLGGFDFGRAGAPPLLATQGSADTVNPPSFTHAFFDGAPPPKFLLMLFGADHLGPYTGAQPDSTIVERVSIDFMDHYLKHQPGALKRMTAAGAVPGASALQADP